MRPLSEKRLFLLDMDGTIYLDETVFDGTLDFLNYVEEIGGRYLFLTNNSSRGIDAYLAKMKRLGIPATKEDFLTSTDALIEDLKGSEKRWYCFGTKSFCRQLKDAGLDVVTELSDRIQGLICGFDTELNFQKLEDACILLNRGVEFVATNPDWVCPTWYGYVPDCGSVCEMLFRATGRRPRFIGKPERAMAELACKKTGYQKEDALLVGDRIYTDIACAVNAGMDSCFVLSGEGVEADIQKYSIHPTYTLPHIRALLDRCKEETK